MFRINPALIAAVLLAGCATVTGSPGETGRDATDEPTGPSASVAPTGLNSPTGTLTITPGAADGPGTSITDAIASAPVRDLVNGSLLIDPAGDVWLCETLGDTTPPTCDGARFHVLGFPSTLPDDILEADGVRWISQPLQLFGDVTVP